MGSCINVSVIIPAYNAESTIARCLDSLVGQDSSGSSVEVIVVDDGSTDATPEILRLYLVKRELNLHIETVANGGPSRARNIGLSLAQGEYVAFCDSDDWLENNALSNVAASVDSSGADIGVFGYKNITRAGARAHVFARRHFMNRREFIAAVLLDSRVNGFAWNKLYRRSVLEGLRLDESLTVCEDMDFNIRLALSRQTLQVLCVPFAYYNYDLRSEMSLTRGSDRHSDMVRLLETYISVDEIAADAKAAIYLLETKRAFARSDSLHGDVVRYSHDYWFNSRCPISEKLKTMYRIASSMWNAKASAES